MVRSWRYKEPVLERAGEIKYVRRKDEVDDPRERVMKGILCEEYKPPVRLVGYRWNSAHKNWILIREEDKENGKKERINDGVAVEEDQNRSIFSLLKPHRSGEELISEEVEVKYVPRAWNVNRKERSLEKLLPEDEYSPPVDFVAFYRDKYDEKWVLWREGEELPDKQKEAKETEEVRKNIRKRERVVSLMRVRRRIRKIFLFWK
ncbi:unnamed protein product [Agarophyton chilense]